MSRWLTEFKNHPFQQNWQALKSESAEAEADDQTISTNVQELARLKKVIFYIDEILNTIDPELVPKTTWENFQQQLTPCLQQVRSYVASKNIANITQANEHIDNLLSYVKPYFTTQQNIIEALKIGAEAYGSQYTGYAESFRDKSIKLLDEIEKSRISSNLFLKETEAAALNSNALAKKLLGGEDIVDSVESTVNTFVADITVKGAEIDVLYKELLVGTTSKKSLILDAEEDVAEKQVLITKHLNSVQDQVDELGKFHTDIFGEPSSASELAGGLKGEIDRRRKDLSAFEGEQKIKTAALLEKINALLPGATSAGLASSYKALKEEFKTPINNYTKAFYGSLLLMIVIAAMMSISQIRIYPVAEIVFIDVAQWDAIIRALIYKTPFVAPVIWLAIFSAKRRSQYERLQQEYAHKEALATSYESYKTQLMELKVDSEELQRVLIDRAIQAIAYNASVTLDGKHEEKPPVFQFLEKLKPDDLKSIGEFFSKFKLKSE
jgi:hypothetical protein